MKADRIGLVVVLASLAAIGAIAYLVFQYQHSDRLADIRSQGVSLVRALSNVPYDQLVSSGNGQGVLPVLQHGASDRDFAYASIVDSDGRTVNEVVSEGLIVPAAEPPAEPSAWLGERRYEEMSGRSELIEFHAPLLTDGELSGFVRLGYRYPTRWPRRESAVVFRRCGVTGVSARAAVLRLTEAGSQARARSQSRDRPPDRR